MEDLQVIRDALERFALTEMTETPRSFLTREEQKYLDLLAQRVRDAVMEREAAIAEIEASRSNMTSAFEDYMAMQEAEARTLEGRQAAERARISRQKTEQSLRNLPEKFLGGKGGATLGAIDLVGGAFGAYATYQQMTAELARKKQTETMN
jgi:DNA replication initiation complex subunit (GINS family)